MPLEAGTEVGQYRLDRRLGGGGMGEVYLARDTKLNRLVAIKFLNAPADPQNQRRLIREARAAAALDHPNICAVYEVGTDAAHGDFIAMQYVEGETLAARLRRGKLRSDEAMNLGGQIAEGLMSAHHHGIVHRDLKPQNIIVTPAGLVRILDFGLAAFAPRTAEAANAPTTSRVTDPEVVVGTPGYMAPEQVRNEPPDFRSDVFALGCVLYECLTGRRAFGGATAAETLGKVLHVDPPPPSDVVPELGSSYDALCGRLLHKVPDERFQSAEEVLGAIRALVPSYRFSGNVIPAPRPRRNLVGLVLVIAAVIGGVYWLQTRKAGSPPPPEAVQRFEQGVEALRDGTYAAARALFLDAIAKFQDYPQAHARLAEAHIALDDDGNANQSLLQVAKLVPDRSRLDADDRLRFDAASAAALRQREAAIHAYQALADLKPDEAGRWIDLGRAQETGAHLPEAIAAYTRALSKDKLSAAARLRLGVLLARTGKTAEGLASIDLALDEYRKQGKTEGEAEALLRKGVVYATNGKPTDARTYFNQVIQLAVAPRYPAQRVGAEFGIAKLDYTAGNLAEAEAGARRAVAEATAANLPTLAAAGLVDIGGFLVGQRMYDKADGYFADGLRIATEKGSERLQNRAKLWQASLRIQEDHPAEALALATEPAEYFRKAGEIRLEKDAKLILARANEALEHYDVAGTLAQDVLAFAEKANDGVRQGGALEVQAGRFTKLGRIPEAIVVRERIDDLHRRQSDHVSLAKDLANHAELLIMAGRGSDAEKLLAEIDQRIAKGEQAYVGRRQRVAVLRTLRASTEQRWNDVLRFAAAVSAAAPRPASGGPAKPTDGESFARIMEQHALAQLKRPGVSPEVLVQWVKDAGTPQSRREWSYWVGRTLLIRGAVPLATSVAAPPLDEPSLKANPELAWRLAMVAAEAARLAGNTEASATISAQAKASIDELKTTWAAAATGYLARPDLSALMKTTH